MHNFFSVKFVSNQTFDIIINDYFKMEFELVVFRDFRLHTIIMYNYAETRSRTQISSIISPFD